MHRQFSLAALIVSLPLAFGAQAAEDNPDEAAAHTRHALMALMGWSIKPLADMTTGKQAFAPERAVLHAQRIAQLGAMIGDAFERDTSGSAVRSAALDAIWETPEDFRGKAEELEAAAGAYATAAMEGEGPAKRAFVKLGGSCKGCHESYKAED